MSVGDFYLTRTPEMIVSIITSYMNKNATSVLRLRSGNHGVWLAAKTEIVKHELTTCKMNYRSRAEPAYASIFFGHYK